MLQRDVLQWRFPGINLNILRAREEIAMHPVKRCASNTIEV